MVSPIRGLNDSSVDTVHPTDVWLTQGQVNAAEAAETRLPRDKVEEETGISTHVCSVETSSASTSGNSRRRLRVPTPACR